MKYILGFAVLVLAGSSAGIAESLEDTAAAAERDIAARFASFGLDGMRRQLYAPGKTDEEKDEIIRAAVQELAKCKVSTSIEFAEDYGLSSVSLLRWQAGWDLTEADRDTITRMDDNALRKKQETCNKAFMDALPKQFAEY